MTIAVPLSFLYYRIKIEPVVGEPWPVGRGAHAACCLDEHPQLLISGGMDKYEETLCDSWLFYVASRKWKKVR